jgi:hypothetical protein
MDRAWIVTSFNEPRLVSKAFKLSEVPRMLILKARQTISENDFSIK